MKDNGPYVVQNGISLCKLHHWAFDAGLFSLKDDYEIVVWNDIKVRSEYELITKFDKKRIFLPKDKTFYPQKIFLDLHRKKYVFE